MILQREITGFNTVQHHTQLCVVGGGLAGMCAAIAAARRGTKVVLMHDRPVLGGNASSEIRMWIRGAHGDYMRETGLVEEIALENIYRNPDMNFSIWDSVLYEKVKLEENITLILNCSCCEANMDGDAIQSIIGWQTTTQTWQKVYADIFSDCSGDSVLAPLTGAEWRMGRESREEFGEDIAPEKGDSCTMGLSCLMQARETTKPVKFIAPAWANKYTREDFPHRLNCSSPKDWVYDNFWWMEIGGVYDSIGDTELLRDKLLKIAYGVWDFIKNSGEVEATNWDLEWMGFLPGKRESRRYVGDYILNQNDVRGQVKFDDIVAYGGWSMDDHHPQGFETKEQPTIFHPAPSPYGIPYRCLYSKNIKNLMFAGRNISATHTANSSARVMATCALVGHAVGDAASIAIRDGLLPRGVYDHKIEELKQILMEDGCYLPWNTKKVSSILDNATITCSGADASILWDGVERVVDGVDHAWEGTLDTEVITTLDTPTYVEKVRIVFDSDLNRDTWEGQKGWVKTYPMKCNRFLDDTPVTVPKTMVKSYQIWIDEGNGIWSLCKEVENNYQRLAYIPVQKIIKRVKFVPLHTWGTEQVRVYAFELA